MLDLNEVADTYLRYHAQHNDADFWAWQEVDRIVRENRELDRAWEITFLLLRKADTDEALGYIAAGPLEDLIDIYADEALDLIEQACDKDSRLQLALSGVWLEPKSLVLGRWRALMTKYRFDDGSRQPLSPHSDSW
jgi:hypothetical protein